MMRHSYLPILPKYSIGGEIHILYESHKPMNEKSPGNLEQKEKANAPRKILRFQYCLISIAIHFTGMLFQWNSHLNQK